MKYRKNYVEITGVIYYLGYKIEDNQAILLHVYTPEGISCILPVIIPATSFRLKQGMSIKVVGYLITSKDKYSIIQAETLERTFRSAQNYKIEVTGKILSKVSDNTYLLDVAGTQFHINLNLPDHVIRYNMLTHINCSLKAPFTFKGTDFDIKTVILLGKKLTNL